jgi:anoctamin-1
VFGWVISVSDIVVLCEQGQLKVPGSLRNLLYCEWAAFSNCLHYKPLDYIKEYFGVKIALYFAWL